VELYDESVPAPASARLQDLYWSDEEPDAS
jgi:hypothetical protein